MNFIESINYFFLHRDKKHYYSEIGNTFNFMYLSNLDRKSIDKS